MRTSIVLALALALLGACFQEPDADDDFGSGPTCPEFQCSTDADCLQGFVCTHGACGMVMACSQLPSDCPQDGLSDPFANDCIWTGCNCYANDRLPPPPPPPPPACTCTTDAQAQAQGFAACDETTWTCTNTPQPPSSCAAQVTCTTAPPSCGAGQVPSVRDGCYTGGCRGIAGCDVPPACTALTHEADCTARSDCEALYTGLDCTDASGNACTSGDANCTCKQFEFSSCAAQ